VTVSIKTECQTTSDVLLIIIAARFKYPYTRRNSNVRIQVRVPTNNNTTLLFYRIEGEINII